MPDSPTPLRIEALLAHTGWVRALAHRLVVDPGRAEDVAQQTWVAALEHPPRTLVSPKAWLAAVLRNVARETRRGDERRSRRERASARSGTLPSAEELVAAPGSRKK